MVVQDVVLFVLAGLGVVIAVLLVVMAGTLRSLSKPSHIGKVTLKESTERKRERLEHMASVNQELVSTKAGISALVNYHLSEAAMTRTLDRIEDRVIELQEPSANAPDLDRDAVEKLIEEVFEEQQRRRGPQWFWDGVDYVKKNKGKIAGHVFGKVNSLLSGMVGGGKGD